MNTSCSCGKTETHIVMRRTSADGIFVVLWSDGAVTGVLGAKLRDVPIVRPKTPDAVSRERRVGRRFMEWVSIYNVAELGSIYAASRKEEKLRAKAGI